MLKLNKVHHIAIICSDYEKSKKFYTEILGFKLVGEHYRNERQSFKTDLSLNGEYILELFSFPDPPKRVSRPEACGMRHLAFEVDDIEQSKSFLENHGIIVESVRTDEYTNKRFCFFSDPDNLPIELYEK